MRYITFGTQRTKASQIVLGLMRTRDSEPSEVLELIKAALSAGINMLDTAPVYGKSERLLGEVFKANPGLRDQIILQTKVGLTHDPDRGHSYYDFSKQHILESVDASLRKLHTDHIDSLLLHRPDALMEPDEIQDAFQTLRDTGKVLDFGVSNQNLAMIRMLSHETSIPLVANQMQLSVAFAPMIDAMFNVNQKNDYAAMRDGGVLEYARQHHMVIQSWSPLQYGHMEGSFLESEHYPELNHVLNRMAHEHGVTPSAIALAWVLRLPGTMQAIIGTTRPHRVRDAACACNVSLTRSEWYELYRAANARLP